MEYTLRPFKETDLHDLVRHANNFEIAKNLTDKFPHPYTENDGKNFIDICLQSVPAQVRVIEIDGRLGGAIGLHPQSDIRRKNIELGYWLAQPYWGKGIMTKAVQETVKYGFEIFDTPRIFACAFGTNIGSQKVLEKAGFKLEVKLAQTIFKNGVYLDEFIYAIRRHDFENSESFS